MEVFEWYLGNADGSPYRLSIANCIELPSFLIDVDDFVGPLYKLLQKGRARGTPVQVFDKIVYSDPRRKDPSLWDGADMEEIKRVNPKLIKLLAALPAAQIEATSAAWLAEPNVRSLVPYWDASLPDDEIRTQLTAVLQNMVALAKRSIKTEKHVMERFLWPTK